MITAICLSTALLLQLSWCTSPPLTESHVVQPKAAIEMTTEAAFSVVVITAESSCPAACGICPPAGFDGACCHGNVTCETRNWTNKTCTPAYGTWCTRGPPPPPPPPPPPEKGLLLGTYFANWAQYRLAGYAYTAADLLPIVRRLSEVNYMSIYFCPPAGYSPMPYWAVPPYGHCTDELQYTIMSVDPEDDAFLRAIDAMRTQQPSLKLILTLGGWNFPSYFFSRMVATNESRSAFIASGLAWISRYNADGLELDWEYPCSPARLDQVEMDCGYFRPVPDLGGVCPDDTTNIVLFYQELRAALPAGKTITVASQAAKTKEDEMNVAQLHPLVDRFHIMTYDYSVSNIPDAGPFAPNCPLFTPVSQPSILQMSINYTVNNYLSVGVPRSKIMVGVPLYGRTWYNPSLAAAGAWKGFGQPSVIQGKCCGPLKDALGAAPGLGAYTCGTYMISELLAAAPQLNIFDAETQSNIAYFNATGADRYTDSGVWVSWNDKDSMAAIVSYVKTQGLAGVFTFDAGMDTRTGGQWTYEYTAFLADQLGRD